MRAALEKPKGQLIALMISGKVTNMIERGVIEPLKGIIQGIKSTTEISSMILRIDDVIASTKPKEEKPGSPEYEE